MPPRLSTALQRSLETTFDTSGRLIGVVNTTSAAAFVSSTVVATGGTLIMSFGLNNLGLYVTSGAPTVSAAKGSFCLRTDGTGIADRLYCNTNSSTGWTAIATAG